MIQAGPDAVTPGKGVGTWVLLATILGSSMAFIDGTVVNVALPVLQRELNATAADLQWVVESYALLLAALILVGGSLGDRLGRARVYAAGVALFTAASLACGLAPNVGVLIAARAVQGIGGALLVPGSLAIISATFSGDGRGKAIGTWSAYTTVTAALGPVLGGWLVQTVSWRAAFFINIPIAAVVLAMVTTRVPESRDETATGHLDLLGAVLATVGLGGLVYGLIRWGSSSLSDPVVWGSLMGGAVALALFALAEAREQAPMMPLSLFRSRTFSGTNLLTLLLYGALGGALYYLPFNLQQVQGYSATAAGASLLPFTVIMFLLSRWTGGLVTRVGARPPLTVGPLIAAAGFLLFTVPGVGGSYWTTYFPAVVVLGLGMAITVAPLTTAVMGAVEQSHAGVASGVNNAVSRAAGLLAIAILGIAVSTTFTNSLESHLTGLSLSPATHQAISAQRDRLAGVQAPAGTSAQTARAIHAVVRNAFVDSFRLAMRLGALLAALSALSAFLLIPGKPPAAGAGAGDPAPPRPGPGRG